MVLAALSGVNAHHALIPENRAKAKNVGNAVFFGLLCLVAAISAK